MDRDYILRYLHAQVNVNGHIIGAALGSGMTAKYVAMGGADFILALSAGKYRAMGRSSYASYFCYGNNNEIVMDMGTRELLPIIHDIPILFGLLATDPEIHLYDYLLQIKESGFAGIVNFPTISLIDGQFRKALEEEGNTFDKEIEAIKLAHYLDLFTVAFVTNEEETKQMLDAGADVICINLGLTKGGFLGAKKYLSLYESQKIAEKNFKICDDINKDVLKMIYSGPINTPIDMQYIYQNTSCQGYIGGSSFERIPAEKAIYNATKAFKSYKSVESDLMVKITESDWDFRDYTEFIKKYIEEHYMEVIHLGDLALVTHISPSYLSTKFKKNTGMSFTEYLLKYRINKAKELLKNNNFSCKEVALKVGYTDYIQFTKIFKKQTGITPGNYKKNNSNNN
ncbi:phosphoenolpyruvate hydrolase family protein [Intestinibacter sp.]